MTVKITITEFGDDVVLRPSGAIIEPPVALVEQTALSVTTASSSAAFGVNTTMVRLCADTAFHYKFGTAPTATANSRRVGANVHVWVRVPKGESYKVSCYDGTT